MNKFFRHVRSQSWRKGGTGFLLLACWSFAICKTQVLLPDTVSLLKIDMSETKMLPAIITATAKMLSHSPRVTVGNPLQDKKGNSWPGPFTKPLCRYDVKKPSPL